MISIAAAVLAVSLIVLIILIIVGIKSETEKGGEDVIKNVYIYLVLFATLMMTIGGSVGSFMALADIIVPIPYYQTFDEYRKWGSPERPSPSGEVTVEELTEVELQERYDAMILAEKERQINRAKNNLIKSLGWIVIPLPVFIYFQRRLKSL